jgi:hypothetical protein
MEPNPPGFQCSRDSLANRNDGGSRSAQSGDSFFAIPTKDHKIKTLPLAKISSYVDAFIEYANGRPDVEFKVTAIGCGLAGFHHHEIAPLFAAAPNNCSFDEAWKPYLGGHSAIGERLSPPSTEHSSSARLTNKAGRCERLPAAFRLDFGRVQ